MRSVFIGNTYNGNALSESCKNNQGFYVEILQAIKLLLEEMINRHSSVFFVRFDLTYPAGSSLRYPDNNDLVSKFSETLALYCKRKGYDPRYLWVRELSVTGQIHYHFMLLLNGNVIQNAHSLILGYATKLWQHYLGIEDGKGLVHLCRSKENSCYYDDLYGGVKIKRKDPHFQQVYEKCYEIASYLAKRYSKEGSPAYTNRFRCSRLNRDNSF
jgi:hypothetical protein